MPEYTMELVSLEEVGSIGDRLTGWEETDNGYLCTFVRGAGNNMYTQQIIPAFHNTPSAKAKEYVIFASLETGNMYIGKNGGTTFNASEAKTFTKAEAQRKAVMMRKHGKYYWQYSAT